MSTNSITRKITITGLCIALGIVLPIAFHTIAGAGQIFLPMHIPIIICGFATGPLFGLLCGIACPIISSLTTGMPPMAVLPGMVFELAAYGFVSGLMYRIIHSKNNYIKIYVSLIIAMIVGRSVSGFVNGVIFSRNAYSFATWIQLSFVVAIPGIFIQLLLIPILINALIKSRFLDFEDENILGLPRRNKKYSKLSQKYFDNLANEAKNNLTIKEIDKLLEIIDLPNNCSVLDIACGTGVLDNALINKGASKVVGIDLSNKMIDIAKENHTNQTNIEYIAKNFYEFNRNNFDVAIIFNSYPHFIDRKSFAKKLDNCLKIGGKFVILHDIGINAVNEFTKDRKMSQPLDSAINESKYFANNFDIKQIIDENNFYAIIGQKK
ncbi:MAG: ECF transporter S component [Clostridia bacterium]